MAVVDGDIVKSERLEGSLHRLMKSKGRGRWSATQSKKGAMDARFERARKILDGMEEGEEIDEEKVREIARSFLDPKEEYRLTVTAVTHKVVAGKVKVSVDTKLGEERHTHVIDIPFAHVKGLRRCVENTRDQQRQEEAKVGAMTGACVNETTALRKQVVVFEDNESDSREGNSIATGATYVHDMKMLRALQDEAESMGEFQIWEFVPISALAVAIKSVPLYVRYG